MTSPPYFGLRDYGVAGQLGLEPTLTEYLATMVEVFRGVWRALRDDGTLWLNIGDSYSGGKMGRDDEGESDIQRRFARYGTGRPKATAKGANGVPRKPTDGFKPKDLMMVPARLAIALQDDGWYLRSDIIWHKPNPMPESVRDRPTSAHEHIFLLTKSPRYFYDADAVRTPAKSETTKMPDGWDTGEGGHGSFHRNGREQGVKVDKQRGHGRRHDGFNDRWDEMPKAEQQANGANLRNVWTVATQAFKSAHFATFPEALVEPCIRAGTSEKGACGTCGAPWMRITAVERGGPSTRGDRKESGTRWREGFAFKGGGSPTGTVVGSDTRGMLSLTTMTTGWEPSCKCGTDVVPCRVLDPFGGSGTVGLVADRLGRDAILIELNPAYGEMAKARIVADAPMFAEVAS